MSKSILQDKDRDRSCYLCRILHEIDMEQIREEHHVMFGGQHRKKAERYGLKVYLCIPHHRTGNEAVHKNAEISDLLKEIAQIAFEKKHGHELWMKEFGRNYISDEDRARYLPEQEEEC